MIIKTNELTDLLVMAYQEGCKSGKVELADNFADEIVHNFVNFDSNQIVCSKNDNLLADDNVVELSSGESMYLFDVAPPIIVGVASSEISSPIIDNFQSLTTCSDVIDQSFTSIHSYYNEGIQSIVSNLEIHDWNYFD